MASPDTADARTDGGAEPLPDVPDPGVPDASDPIERGDATDDSAGAHLGIPLQSARDFPSPNSVIVASWLERRGSRSLRAGAR